ncbi:MAG: flippase activity-associated protein Agl23 [Anaerolineales bacterium]
MGSELHPTTNHSTRPAWLNLGLIILIIILALGLASRLIQLGDRVMSHDEINHVYWAWMFYDTGNYQADPLSHGPFQFHILALSYLLFGDNDVSARLPAALAGVAVLGILWLFRRWLGRAGALAAAAIALISPYMLYYSRYARNEIFVAAEVLLTIWVIFRYLETRQSRWLFGLAALLALHAATKETYFLFTAPLLLFLAAVLSLQLLRLPWINSQRKRLFGVGLAMAAVGFGLALTSFLRDRTMAGEAAIPAASVLVFIGAAFGILGTILLLIGLIGEFGRSLEERFPVLDLIVVITTVTLPQLAALPAQIFGWNPLDISDPFSYSRTVGTLIILTGLAVGLGLAWGRKRWLIIAGIFSVIYFPLYTTFFTNPGGVFTGLVKSLGYWLVQQGVERGSQPWYYYLLIQIPIYEYLPALGALAAAVIALTRRPLAPKGTAQEELHDSAAPVQSIFVAFLFYWAITAFFIYTYAGERMPWLTVHIVLPLILLSGWAFHQLFGRCTLRDIWSWRSAAMVALMVLAAVSLAGTLSSLLGWNQLPGLPLDAVRRFAGAITPAFIGALAGWMAWKLLQEDSWGRVSRLAALTLLALIAIQTARTAVRAAFTNKDSAEEFLVYAHAGPGPKIALQEIETLSYNLTGGLDLPVAYDNDAAYPYWWYLRHFSQAFSFGTSPSRELLRYPVIIAGENNYARVEAYLGKGYRSVVYERMWWPIEDYSGLTWDRVRAALASPEMRRALWELWFNRNYEPYGQLKGRDFSPRGWSPSSRMKVYVREDLASAYPGAEYAGDQVDETAFIDTYGNSTFSLMPQLVIGGPGAAPGELQAPRQIAFSADGKLVVADSDNHRIQIFSSSGEPLLAWGQYADAGLGPAPGGTFNQPWGVAVSDGDIFVADTWNHRIERFDDQGNFLNSFGFFGTEGGELALYGPRSVAVDDQGRVYVVDTGNKRVLVYDAQGTPLAWFGGGGIEPGKLDEPVGIAIGADGRIFVVDTWNQRVQLFRETATDFYQPVGEWPVDAWYGQSVENKPFIAVSLDGQVCVSDPEGARVLCFDEQGTFLRGIVSPELSRPSGLAFDSSCRLWVADAETDQISAFDLGGCQ